MSPNRILLRAFGKFLARPRATASRLGRDRLLPSEGHKETLLFFVVMKIFSRPNDIARIEEIENEDCDWENAMYIRKMLMTSFTFVHVIVCPNSVFNSFTIRHSTSRPLRTRGSVGEIAAKHLTRRLSVGDNVERASEAIRPRVWKPSLQAPCRTLTLKDTAMCR